jgi:hypothetical protein
MRKIPIIISLLLCAQLAFAAEYAVRPPASCPNNGNGASWACAATAGGVGAKNAIPSAIEHGSTYYLAGGSYASASFGSNLYTGADWAIVRKATTAAHGTAALTNWDDAYAADQAIFPSMYIKGHYIEVDGVTGSKTTGYGIKIEHPNIDLHYNNDLASLWMYGSNSPNALDHVIIKHLEISMTSGTDCEALDQALADGYKVRTYTVKATVGIQSNITIQNNYIHGGSTNIQMGRWRDSEIKENYFGQNCSRGLSHGQQISPTGGAHRIKLYNNEFHNSETYIVGAHNNGTKTPPVYGEGNSYWDIFNNISVGGRQSYQAAESGEYDCLMSSQIHHNTFVDGECASEGCIDSGMQLDVATTKSYAYNNLFYNMTSVRIGMNCGTTPTAGCVVHNNNAFLKSSGYDTTIAEEANEQVDTGDHPTIFTNYGTGNYTINATDETAIARIIDKGKTDLGLLYKDDKAGNERDAAPDMGAYEAGASADTTPPTISSATINADGDELTIAFPEITFMNTSTGFTLNMSGGAAGISYVSGSGTGSWLYLITGRNIDTAETGSLDYVTVADGIEDASGNDLASTGESDIAVTNNSTYSPSATTYTVTPSVSSGGCSISPSTPQAVVSGETKQFTCTAINNFACVAWTGTCGGSGTTTLTTSAITGDCTVIQGCYKIAPDVAIGSGAAVTLGSGAVGTLY